MKRFQKFIRSFSIFEILLWSVSSLLVIGSVILSRSGILNAIAAEIGVTSLVMIAKGYPLGQALTVVFSVLYAILSYQTRYYGEMITYLCMTLPCALVTMIHWLKHPFQKGEPEVEVQTMTKKKFALLVLVSVLTSVIFYFILRALNTPQLFVGTLSVLTSMLAVGFLLLRSPYYAVAYAANDVVLIVLWVLAAMKDPSALPTVMNFVAFLANDIYGFISWKNIQKKQARIRSESNR